MKKLLLFTIFIFGITCLSAQSEVDLVKATVSKSNIEGHIYFLADDLLKGRETGTPENKIAAAYLANTLRAYGVKPNPKTGDYYQQVPLEKVSPPKRVVLSVGSKEMKNKVVLKTSKMDYTGASMYIGYGLEEDYTDKDVKGKVLFAKAGSETAKDARGAFGLRSKKLKLAQEAGAVALVEFLQSDDNMWGFIDHNFNSDRISIAEDKKDDEKSAFGHLWVQDSDGSLAQGMSSQKKQSVKLQMEGDDKKSIMSQNVIGVVEGTDPKLKNEYIIYSAHYDHVGIGTPDDTGDVIYNGARDNAVGTTTVLSMAENLAKYPTKRSALFILFTGEEKGLLGSNFYVENPVLPLKQMVFCFNSDNAGYNDTSLATIVGLERTTASQHIKDAATTFALTATDDPAPEQGLFDRSDNVHFAAKGIPAPTFSLGFTAFNGDVTKYYHRPGDHADNMDYDYLTKFFKSYVLAGRNIANDPNKPVWVAGDKYETAAQELYGN